MNIKLCVVNGQACRMILHWASVNSTQHTPDPDTSQSIQHQMHCHRSKVCIQIRQFVCVFISNVSNSHFFSHFIQQRTTRLWCFLFSMHHEDNPWMDSIVLLTPWNLRSIDDSSAAAEARTPLWPPLAAPDPAAIFPSLPAAPQRRTSPAEGDSAPNTTIPPCFLAF